MTWLLLFCSFPYGSVCLAPITEPNQKVCEFVGRKMVQTASEQTARQATYRCIAVPSYGKTK